MGVLVRGIDFSFFLLYFNELDIPAYRSSGRCRVIVMQVQRTTYVLQAMIVIPRYTCS